MNMETIHEIAERLRKGYQCAIEGWNKCERIAKEDADKAQIKYDAALKLAKDFQADSKVKDVAISELTAALRDLYDEQNDAPLERRREQWQAAYSKATEMLKKYEPWSLR